MTEVIKCTQLDCKYHSKVLSAHVCDLDSITIAPGDDVWSSPTCEDFREEQTNGLHENP